MQNLPENRSFVQFQIRKMEEKLKCGIIILAAGNSSRLGTPKQILHFRGKSLIRNITDAALAAKAGKVVVVTGANDVIIKSELADLPFDVAHNPSWQEGMGSSIRTGLAKLLLLDPILNAAIITVSDQPFVTAALLQSLYQKATADPHTIVACSYRNTAGTPVLFKENHFDSLLHLNGAEGAKKLIRQFENDVTTIPFALGGIDIDTREDFERLLGL